MQSHSPQASLQCIMWPSCGLKLASPGPYLHVCWRFHYKKLVCSFLMFITYVSRKCRTWQLKRKLLHIPSGNTAWQYPSLYQRSLNNKKCHHGDSCQILALSYCPQHREQTFQPSGLLEKCSFPRTKKQILSLHLYTDETTVTHHNYLVAYTQGKVSAAGSGIRQGSKQFKKFININ
jgi:hypothetical protein